MFTTDSAGKFDVFGHDGDTLGVDDAQVDVLKQINKIGLIGFLKGHHDRVMETETSLEVLSDLTDQYPGCKRSTCFPSRRPAEGWQNERTE